MLEYSKKLTSGLIIFSVLVSEYEKFDFKNDALAGVRANYFNSKNSDQRDRREIELENGKYRLSYNMSANGPLSWKVTKDNKPYQSLKVETGGIYSVMHYTEKGIIYKRQYFNAEHIWIRTEYFDSDIADKLLCRIYPKVVSEITALVIENINDDSTREIKTLFPSAEKGDKTSTALIYSNMGMLWYDEEFSPDNLPKEPVENNACGGFTFNNNSFNPDYKPENRIDLSKVPYLDTQDEVKKVSVSSSKKPSAKYSAYDKIENILAEAHKSNKDLFGEIVSQVFEEHSNESIENIEFAEDIKITEDTENNKYDDVISASESYSEMDDDNFNDVEQSVVSVSEKPDDKEAEEQLSYDTCEKADVLDNISVKGNDVQEDCVSVTEISDAFIQDNTIENNEIKQDSSDIDYDEVFEESFYIAENQPCNAVIITKTGRYAYYGKLDENNCRTGRGRTVNPDGYTSYDGEYSQDMKNGFGVCYYKDGTINYVGNWTNNNRQGCGVGYRLSDKTMHIGKWNSNTPDGYGARFNSDGEFIDVCMYENGKRNGKSVSFNEIGQIVISVYVNGEKISERVIDTEDSNG